MVQDRCVHLYLLQTQNKQLLPMGRSARLTELSYILLTSPNTIRSPAYMGSELSAKVAYQFHNDFDASFTGGIFIPNRKIITAYNLRWLTELTFTVKL